jgi:hypothetical protein
MPDQDLQYVFFSKDVRLQVVRSFCSPSAAADTVWTKYGVGG